jgi:hypothetical protein
MAVTALLVTNSSPRVVVASIYTFQLSESDAYFPPSGVDTVAAEISSSVFGAADGSLTALSEHFSSPPGGLSVTPQSPAVGSTDAFATSLFLELPKTTGADISVGGYDSLEDYFYFEVLAATSVYELHGYTNNPSDQAVDEFTQTYSYGTGPLQVDQSTGDLIVATAVQNVVPEPGALLIWGSILPLLAAAQYLRRRMAKA